MVHLERVVADELQNGRLTELEIDMGETRGAVGVTIPAAFGPSAALTLMKQTIRNHVAARTALI